MYDRLFCQIFILSLEDLPFLSMNLDLIAELTAIGLRQRMMLAKDVARRSTLKANARASLVLKDEMINALKTELEIAATNDVDKDGIIAQLESSATNDVEKDGIIAQLMKRVIAAEEKVKTL